MVSSGVKRGVGLTVFLNRNLHFDPLPGRVGSHWALYHTWRNDMSLLSLYPEERRESSAQGGTVH